MDIRKYIYELFVPPMVKKIYRSIKGHFAKPYISPLPKWDKRNNKMILIGNGPSLTKSIELYYNEIMCHDKLVVNYFALSDLFERLRPEYYLFVDPDFFYVPEYRRESVDKLMQSILNKTTWEMTICVPDKVMGIEIINKLQTNHNIKIEYYNTQFHNPRNLPQFKAWDNNLIPPLMQNSLCVGIYLSLYWHYSETYIIGADLSALEELRIDQRSNKINTELSHFYGNNTVKNSSAGTDAWHLHEYIYAYAKMFEEFYILSQYADYKGLKVYNASEYSWINSFERKKFK